ncbi:ERV/ALR sulfhydryl oxidase domain-containing protein [Amylocystis lapponica]|nr:ERV/ALR sulfhydryl oxidase domain-containing protein [Amylocystis lapponica]
MSETTPSPSKEKEPLPPGMVIGPDGKPCKICTAARFWKPLTKRAKAQDKQQDAQSASAATAALASGQALASQSDLDTRPEHCPPDVEQLGRATWTFLHTTAAYYPERPTPSQRANMLSLLRSLPVLYPCSHCASHLGTNLHDHPPDVSGRLALSRWLCERHNDVNERLGKVRFDCAIEKTDERWKDGPSDGSCD